MSRYLCHYLIMSIYRIQGRSTITNLRSVSFKYCQMIKVINILGTLFLLKQNFLYSNPTNCFKSCKLNHLQRVFQHGFEVVFVIRAKIQFHSGRTISSKELPN